MIIRKITLTTIIIVSILFLSSCTYSQKSLSEQSDNTRQVPTPKSIQPSTIRKNLEIKDLPDKQAIAIVDSGCANLSQLTSHIIHFQDFISHHITPYDDSGHGTSVTYLATQLVPSTKIVELKALNQDDEANSDKILQALEWVSNNYQAYHIKVVNLSLSLGDNSVNYETFQPIITQLYTDGVIIVASSENFSRTPTLPANSNHVISVGNMDDKKTQSQIFTYGSNIVTLSVGGHNIIETGTSYSSIIVSSYILSKINQGNFNPYELKGVLK